MTITTGGRPMASILPAKRECLPLESAGALAMTIGSAYGGPGQGSAATVDVHCGWDECFWTVRRTRKDFDRLRAALAELAPGEKLPELPSAPHALNASLDAASLTPRRADALQAFANRAAELCRAEPPGAAVSDTVLAFAGAATALKQQLNSANARLAVQGAELGALRQQLERRVGAHSPGAGRAQHGAQRAESSDARAPPGDAARAATDGADDALLALRQDAASPRQRAASISAGLHARTGVLPRAVHAPTAGAQGAAESEGALEGAPSAEAQPPAPAPLPLCVPPLALPEDAPPPSAAPAAAPACRVRALKVGWITKRSFFLQQWRPRYLEMGVDGQLRAYDAEEGDGAPTLCLQLARVSDVCPWGLTSFDVHAAGHAYAFEAPSACERDEWVRLLRTQARHARGEDAPGRTGVPVVRRSSVP